MPVEFSERELDLAREAAAALARSMNEPAVAERSLGSLFTHRPSEASDDYAMGFVHGAALMALLAGTVYGVDLDEIAGGSLRSGQDGLLQWERDDAGE
ncbi:MAG: hypothetical protein K9L28_02900 [Synergistales bacterium]|nr:hypothetical protein [Synergistales bacterium]